MTTSLITILAPILGDIIKRVLPADTDKQADIDREVRLSLLENSETLENARSKIILAEANSSSWLASTWRPLLMMVVVAIVAMNFLLFPVLGLIFGVDLFIELPSELWNLLTIGVGGYIVGRSGEKMVDSYTRGREGE